MSQGDVSENFSCVDLHFAILLKEFKMSDGDVSENLSCVDLHFELAGCMRSRRPAMRAQALTQRVFRINMYYGWMVGFLD